jgi:heme A synthase
MPHHGLAFHLVTAVAWAALKTMRNFDTQATRDTLPFGGWAAARGGSVTKASCSGYTFLYC